MGKEVFNRRNCIKLAIVATLVIAIILSMTVLTKEMSDPAHYQETLEELNEKKENVLHFAEVAAAAATAIAAVPGDATTPVADVLADLTSYFLIILAAIYIETYLVTLTGAAAFFILIPAAFLWAIIGIILERGAFLTRAAKIGLFGVILFSVIPISMEVADMIEKTSEASFTVTMEQAEAITEEIGESENEDGNFLEKAIDKIKGGVSGIVEKGQELLKNFLETIAILLVTSCGIPVAVLLFMLWLAKMLLGVSVSIPTERPWKKARRTAGRGPAESP